MMGSCSTPFRTRKALDHGCDLSAQSWLEGESKCEYCCWQCCCFKLPRMTRTRGSPKLAIIIATTRTNANVTGQPNVRTGNRKLKIQSVRYIAAKMLANACRPALRITIRRLRAVELPTWQEAQKPHTAMQCKSERAVMSVGGTPRKYCWSGDQRTRS